MIGLGGARHFCFEEQWEKRAGRKLCPVPQVHTHSQGHPAIPTTPTASERVILWEQVEAQENVS